MRLTAEEEKLIAAAHFLIGARVDQIHPVTLDADNAGTSQCPEAQLADQFSMMRARCGEDQCR